MNNKYLKEFTKGEKTFLIKNLIQYQTDVKGVIYKKYISCWLKEMADDSEFITEYEARSVLEYGTGMFDLRQPLYKNGKKAFSLIGQVWEAALDDTIIESGFYIYFTDKTDKRIGYTISKSVELFQDKNIGKHNDRKFKYYYIHDMEDDYNSLKRVKVFLK